MVYGRIIGNELRDVPPEYLPIWGQRWSGYRAPHGPSPFSTRVFSVDQMSEVGPTLTSPTQFEVTLTEDDDVEDASSESSQFHSFFLSSPLSIQADTTELISRPETPIPWSVHRSSNHPHDRGTGHPPQKSTLFSTSLLPRRQSEQSGTRHPTSDPVLHPPVPHYGIPIQGGHGLLENDHTLWDTDRTSTGILLRDGYSHPSEQLQYTISPHLIPEWQFANAYTPSSAYPIQFSPLSHHSSGCLLSPYQADGRTCSDPTTSPPSSHCFTIPSPQQNVAVHPSRSLESTMHPQYPMVPSWPQGSALPNPPLPWPLQNSGSPPGLGVFYRSVSDRLGMSTQSEGFHSTFARAGAEG